MKWRNVACQHLHPCSKWPWLRSSGPASVNGLISLKSWRSVWRWHHRQEKDSLPYNKQQFPPASPCQTPGEYGIKPSCLITNARSISPRLNHNLELENHRNSAQLSRPPRLIPPRLRSSEMTTVSIEHLLLPSAGLSSARSMLPSPEAAPGAAPPSPGLGCVLKALQSPVAGVRTPQTPNTTVAGFAKRRVTVGGGPGQWRRSTLH